MKFLHAFANIILFILFTVCFCMTGYVYAVKFVNEYFNRNEVIVPDITSLQYSIAEKIVPEQYHLNIENTKTEFSKTVPAGCIITQQPEPNLSVKPGRTVHVTVSKGIKAIECVNVTGLNVRKAQLTLKNCNFNPGIRSYLYNDTEKYGTILSQYPHPLSKVEENTNVHLLVSKGKQTNTFIMPDLKNIIFSDIKLHIKKMGLLIGKVTYEDLETFKPGSIIEHTPKAGDTVKENALLDLVINIGEPQQNSSKRKFQTISFELPNNTQDVTLKMILSDNKGVRQIYKKKHSPNEKIEHVVGYFGNALITIYLDNEKYTELEYK